MNALLPTPQHADGERGSLTMVRGNPTLAGALLPTPTVNDSRGGRNMTAARTAKKDSTSLGWTLCDIAYANLWDRYGPAIARHEHVLGRPAPCPVVDNPNAQRGVSLNPVFVEWMMMLPEGWVTSHGLPRTSELRVLGNGVVPPQARLAWSMLDTLERAA